MYVNPINMPTRIYLVVNSMQPGRVPDMGKMEMIGNLVCPLEDVDGGHGCGEERTCAGPGLQDCVAVNGTNRQEVLIIPLSPSAFAVSGGMIFQCGDVDNKETV